MSIKGATLMTLGEELEIFAPVVSEKLWGEEIYLKWICLKFLFHVFYKSSLYSSMSRAIM